MRYPWILGAAIMMAAAASPAGAETLKVSNEFLTATYDQASGKLSLTAAGADKPFATDSSLADAKAPARMVDVKAGPLGASKVIEFSTACIVFQDENQICIRLQSLLP